MKHLQPLRFLVVACLVAAQQGRVWADAHPVYTLADCLAMGRERSAATRIAQRDRDIGEAAMDQARSEALPQFSLRGSYTRLDELEEIDLGEAPGGGGGGGDAASTFEVGSLDNYEASAEVNQLLFSGGRVRASLRAARASREYYDSSAKEAEDALTRDIRLAFHAILFTRNAVAVRREAVSNLAAHVEQAVAKFDAGTLSEFDLLSARVRVGNERPGLIAAENAYALARAKLRRILLLEEADFRVRGELAFRPLRVSLAEARRLALGGRPAIRQQENVVDLRTEDATAAAARQWPDLRGFFRYAEANPYGFGGEGGEWEGHWTAGLTAEWDIWNGGLTRAKVREKRLELDKARITLEDRRRAVALEVEQAYLAMQHAAEAVEAGAGTIAQARKALEIAERRYASGLSTQLELADSTAGLRQARLIRLSALRDYLDAVARLQFACGPRERDFYAEIER